MNRKSQDLVSRLREELAARLPEKRYLHVLGVEGLAVSLALRHHIDPEKALLAALLHDYFKAEKKDVVEKMMRKASSPMVPRGIDWEHPKIWHGIVAADWAAEELSLTDADILDAVYFHTTGCKGLNPVGLVLYIADCLEPSRNFSGVSDARKRILGLPMMEAAREVSVIKLNKLDQKATTIHPDTLAMRDWLVKQTTPP